MAKSWVLTVGVGGTNGHSARKEVLLQSAFNSTIAPASGLTACFQLCHLQELDRLKEWQAVTKRVEADKLHEQLEARAQERLEAEQQRAALEMQLTKLQVSISPGSYHLPLVNPLQWSPCRHADVEPPSFNGHVVCARLGDTSVPFATMGPSNPQMKKAAALVPCRQDPECAKKAVCWPS